MTEDNNNQNDQPTEEQKLADKTQNDHAEYNEEQIERLWQCRNNVITYFNSFVGSFLVAESVLLAVVGMLASSDSAMDKIRFPIIFLGFVLTILWMYVQAKQRLIIQNLKKVCLENIPEYKEQQNLRQNSVWKFSTTRLLTFVLPILFAAIWIFILYAVL
jgi:hypothetical protein